MFKVPCLIGLGNFLDSRMFSLRLLHFELFLFTGYHSESIVCITEFSQTKQYYSCTGIILIASITAI